MTRRPTEKKPLDGLNEDDAHANEQCKPLAQEMEPPEPLERLKGSVLHYDNSTAPAASWDEWFDQVGVFEEYFEEQGRTRRYYRVPAELFEALLERLNERERLAALEELSALDQELGLGYE